MFSQKNPNIFNDSRDSKAHACIYMVDRDLIAQDESMAFHKFKESTNQLPEVISTRIPSKNVKIMFQQTQIGTILMSKHKLVSHIYAALDFIFI